MSSGRVFQSLGLATANDRSLTVISQDRGTSSSEFYYLPKLPLLLVLVELAYISGHHSRLSCVPHRSAKEERTYGDKCFTSWMSFPITRPAVSQHWRNYLLTATQKSSQLWTVILSLCLRWCSRTFQHRLWCVFHDFVRSVEVLVFFKHGQHYLRGTLLRTLYKLLCHFASNVSVTTNANVLEMSLIINSWRDKSALCTGNQLFTFPRLPWLTRI